MKQIISTLICLLILTSCADTHQLIRQEGTPTIRLGIDDAIYVSVPKDGSDGSYTYDGSGQMAAQYVINAFQRHARTVKDGRAVQSFDDALESAKKHNCKYLVYLTLLHWEDRATEWNGIPDRVELKVEVVSVTTGDTVTSAIVKGKSGLATFGGDHPQDLLPQPLEEFLLSLY